MPYLGKNADDPVKTQAINDLMEKIIQMLETEPADVKTNAITRLAVTYLAIGGVTRKQAMELFDGLADALKDVWVKPN